MTSVATRDPFAGLVPLSTAMNRVFESAFLAPSGLQQFPLDVYETDSEFVVRASMPGYRPDDVKVTILNNQLTLEGSAPEWKLPEGARYLAKEWNATQFQRTVRLPAAVAP